MNRHPPMAGLHSSMHCYPHLGKRKLSFLTRSWKWPTESTGGSVYFLELLFLIQVALEDQKGSVECPIGIVAPQEARIPRDPLGPEACPHPLCGNLDQ